MTISILFLVGRVLFALFWLDNAWNHIARAEGLVGYAQSKGIKSPKAAVIGTGILLAFGGLSILSGVLVYWGIAALVLFLLGVTFRMHTFWKEQDPGARAGARVDFMKNIALLAALLMMLMIPQPWEYSLGF